MPDQADAPTLELCREEVERMTTRFVEWYTGNLTDIEPIAGALTPEFELVSADTDRTGREETLAAFRDAHDVYDGGIYDIEIDRVDLLHSGPDHAMVRYDEYETAPEGNTHRVCTSLLRPDGDAPAGLAWVSIQETTIEETGSPDLFPGF